MKALHLGIVLALMVFPSAALAQSTVLQAGPLTPGHNPMYSLSGGSQPVVQDSGTSAGGVAGANPSEIGLTARGTGTPPFADQGNGPNGENFCDYDAPITNTDGYHYLCLSPNALGGGLLSYGAGGIADALPFTLLINGEAVQFPGVLVTPSFQDLITATGTNQATAFVITKQINGFTTVASGTGTLLPIVDDQAVALLGGYTVEIINAGANPLSVYPPTGQSINGGSANAAVTIYMNDVAHFIYRGLVSGTGAWYAR